MVTNKQKIIISCYNVSIVLIKDIANKHIIATVTYFTISSFITPMKNITSISS